MKRIWGKLLKTLHVIISGPLLFSMTTEVYDSWGSKIRQLNHSFSNEDERIHFTLNPALDYFLSIHDPHFFYSTYMSQSIPKAFFPLKIGRYFVGKVLLSWNRRNVKVWLLAFEAVQYERIDSETSRCEESEDYSFTACVKVIHEEANFTWLCF